MDHQNHSNEYMCIYIYGSHDQQPCNKMRSRLVPVSLKSSAIAHGALLLQPHLLNHSSMKRYFKSSTVSRV